jgi:hypothetical protein
MQNVGKGGNRQEGFGEKQDEFLEDGGPAQTQPVSTFEQVEQQVGAVRGEEIGLRLGPAGQHIVRAHGIAGRKIQDHNAPPEGLGCGGIGARKAREALVQQEERSLEKISLWINHPKPDGSRVGRRFDQRLQNQQGEHALA